MFRINRKQAMGLALGAIGFWTAATALADSSPAPASTAAFKPNQMIMLKEAGKPDRRCVIVSVSKTADGGNSYRVKATDNGEIMTVLDRMPPGASPKSAATATVASNGSDPSKSSKHVSQNQTSVPPSAGCSVCNKAQTSAGTAPPATATVSATKPQDDTAGPALTPGGAVTPATPPKPQRTFFDRLFGRNKPSSTQECTTCKKPQSLPPVVSVTPDTSPFEPKASAVVTAQPMLPPVSAGMGPAMSRTPAEPLAVGFGPTLPLMPGQMPLMPGLAPRALYPEMEDPIQQAAAFERHRSDELKDELKNAELPSRRIMAAEALAAGNRGRTADARAALMLSAQDDPAGCVRASCIRCLSQQGLRDQAFMTLLVSAQSDKDAMVREEAEYAMKRATKR